MLSNYNVCEYSYIMYFMLLSRIRCTIGEKGWTMLSLSNKLGNHLKTLREQHHMNQSVLAEKLNIRRQTISAYERGVSTPDIFTLIKLADIYQISLDDLVGRNFP